MLVEVLVIVHACDSHHFLLEIMVRPRIHVNLTVAMRYFTNRKQPGEALDQIIYRGHRLLCSILRRQDVASFRRRAASACLEQFIGASLEESFLRFVQSRFYLLDLSTKFFEERYQLADAHVFVRGLRKVALLQAAPSTNAI